MLTKKKITGGMGQPHRYTYRAEALTGHSSNLGIFVNEVLETKNFQFLNFGNYHQALHTFGLINLSMVHIS